LSSDPIVCQATTQEELWAGWGYPLLRWVTNKLLMWHASYRFEQVEPVRAIGQLAPRSILLIHEQQDRLIPPAVARQRRAAAGWPKALWLVPGAEHTWVACLSASLQMPDRYMAHLTAFFQQTLLRDRSVAHL
jgi:hypothetical protein